VSFAVCAEDAQPCPAQSDTGRQCAYGESCGGWGFGGGDPGGGVGDGFRSRPESPPCCMACQKLLNTDRPTHLI
jgi:hypothetical protein